MLGLAEPGPDRVGVGVARAFRLLGLAQVPDLSVPAAAALLDQPVRETERVLERLADGNLVQAITPGRYRMHDLLRIFATERAEAEETGPDRMNAIMRLLTWYARISDNGRHRLMAGFLPAVALAASHGPPKLGWRLAATLLSS
jgi:hypothetical protein